MFCHIWYLLSLSLTAWALADPGLATPLSVQPSSLSTTMHTGKHYQLIVATHYRCFTDDIVWIRPVLSDLSSYWLCGGII